MSGQFVPHDNEFKNWLDQLRSRAVEAGISERTLRLSRAAMKIEKAVLERQSNQTEFTLNISEYIDRAVSAKRVKNGRSKFRQNRTLLAAISAHFRVDAEVIMAIWGVETNYGSIRGDWSILSALTTLAYAGHRSDFFESELITALEIIDSGDVKPSALVGSWAGAMGHGQFMPSSFKKFAVDYDMDGRRDIWGDDPTDGLASIANYLLGHGWRANAPWGVEVDLPDGFDFQLAGRTIKKSAAEWSDLGIVAADGTALAEYGPGSVLVPAGALGPAFMVYRNFDVLLTYNRAEAYAIAVGHLADRLSGGKSLKKTCADDLRMLTRDEMRELQEKLSASGFDTQGADGFFGPNTSHALRAFQVKTGLVPDGIATGAALEAIRASS